MTKDGDVVIVRCCFAPHPQYRPDRHTAWLDERLVHFDTETQMKASSHE